MDTGNKMLLQVAGSKWLVLARKQFQGSISQSDNVSFGVGSGRLSWPQSSFSTGGFVPVVDNRT